jgi:hypothetical protein
MFNKRQAQDLQHTMDRCNALLQQLVDNEPAVQESELCSVCHARPGSRGHRKIPLTTGRYKGPGVESLSVTPDEFICNFNISDRVCNYCIWEAMRDCEVNE